MVNKRLTPINICFFELLLCFAVVETYQNAKDYGEHKANKLDYTPRRKVLGPFFFLSCLGVLVVIVKTPLFLSQPNPVYYRSTYDSAYHHCSIVVAEGQRSSIFKGKFLDCQHQCRKYDGDPQRCTSRHDDIQLPSIF